MKRAIWILALAAGCASTPRVQPDSPTDEPADRELVTRQSEPLVELPRRESAERFRLSDRELRDLDEALQAEADSNEIVVATGLEWEDGARTVAVAHVRYPPLDMPESAFDSAVDEAALDRCEEQFAGCYEGDTTCSQDAHEACVRSAYSDPFVYMSAHLGLDCGVYELSMFALNDQPRLQERKVLGEMVCDFDPHYSSPAAKDLDGDGGAELVYAYTYASPERPDRYLVDSAVIVDANALSVQYRHTMSAASDDQFDGGVVTGIEMVDETGDGYPDLVVNQVSTRGYCPPIGYALGPDFVLNDDELGEEPPCDMTVDRRVVPYDAEADAWIADESETEEPVE
jgi:hypothetical protein